MRKEASKKIWITFLVFIIIGCLMFLSWYDPYLNKYAGKLKKQYPVIRKLETSGVGPHRFLDIYLKRNTGFRDAENIFLTVMEDFEGSSLKEYLSKKHKKKDGADMGTIQVYISYKNKEDFEHYGFISYLKEGFHTWYYEGGDGDKKTYQVSDYLK